jgi:pre-mRNA-processing factor 39
MIHLESIGSSPKRIEFLDSLVEKFITPNSENATGVAGSSEREELSCVFLEVIFSFGNPMNFSEFMGFTFW